MTLHDETIDRLAAHDQWGYHARGPAATEPTALAAIALASIDHPAAQRALNWLSHEQQANGSLGVMQGQPEPRWPTSLAALAWIAADRAATKPRYEKQIDAAVGWLLSARGTTLTPEQSVYIGHDTSLVGWPWVIGTHSWLEPTALSILALKAAGQGKHPRTREAVYLVYDRMLPVGGWNYGNTFIMGQQLRPHLQPTGMALLAIARDTDGFSIERSMQYLRRNLSAETTTASLCYGLLGLAAHGLAPDPSASWLAAAYRRTRRDDESGHALALLALAALGDRSPLIELPRESDVPARENNTPVA